MRACPPMPENVSRRPGFLSAPRRAAKERFTTEAQRPQRNALLPTRVGITVSQFVDRQFFLRLFSVTSVSPW